MNIVLQESFELTHCPACGVAFALPSDLIDSLRRSKERFYCPNGHGQSYSGPNAAEQEVISLRLALQKELTDKGFILSQLDRERREAKRLKRRITNGLCPCCNRSFADLRRHIATKHKDYPTKDLPPGGQKQIEPQRLLQ